MKHRKTLAGIFTTVAAAAGAILLPYGAAPDAHDDPRYSAAALPDPACRAAIRTALADTATPGPAHSRAVIVIPGFMTGDLYTKTLRIRLERAGYLVYGWDAGINTGPDELSAQKLRAQLQRAYHDSGEQKVSLIGYSLGGIYARELARAHPDMVANVITLAAPVNLAAPDHPRHEVLHQSHQIFNGGRSGGNGNDVSADQLSAQINEPLPVPVTAILSYHDWIVSYDQSLIPAHDHAENIIVPGGHIIMPFSSAAASIAINRAGQDGNNWHPLSDKHCDASPSNSGAAGARPRT